MTTIAVTTESVEVKPQAPQAQRRRFNSAEKRRILRAYETAQTTSERGAILRREGLYASHIGRWRHSRDEHELKALEPAQRGPKAQPGRAQIAQLERENAELRKQLEQTRALLELQKKATAIMDMLTTSNSNEKH